MNTADDLRTSGGQDDTSLQWVAVRPDMTLPNGQDVHCGQTGAGLAGAIGRPKPLVSLQPVC